MESGLVRMNMVLGFGDADGILGLNQSRLVNWQSPAHARGGALYFRKKGTLGFKKVHAQSSEYDAGIYNARSCSAEMTSLSPDTEYEYYVENFSEPLQRSPVTSFRTYRAAPERVKTMIFGDSKSGYEICNEIAYYALKELLQWSCLLYTSTLSTMLYANVKNRQTVQAYIMSLVLIGISVLIVYINQRAIGRRKNYATMGGKGGRSTPVRLGKWKPVVLGVLLLFLSLFVALPIFILIAQSFMLQSGDYSLSNFTLHFWIGESNPSIAEGEPGLFRNPMIWKASLNTLKLVLISSVIATVTGLILGYAIARGRGKTSGKLIDQLSFAPYLIPSISFSAIYLSM